MGGDWYWGGAKSSSALAAKKGRGRVNKQCSSAAAPAGCMNAVLHLLDFHYFQFGVRVPQDQEPSSPWKGFSSSPSSPPLLPEELTPPKGTEAPRNSLELEHPPFPSSHHYNRDYESLNIPMGMQIRTSIDQRPPKPGFVRDFPQEYDSSSAGNRTPTLIARLMGLDILPASCSSSPRLSSTSEVTPPYSDRKRSCHHNQIHTVRTQQGPRRSWGSDTDALSCGGTHSLPETPRVSLARRSTEATADRRLSLQIINRENSNSSDEFDLSRFRMLLRRKEAKIRELEENRCPSYSAWQFVKQAADKAGRKVGVDITNTVKDRERDGRDKEVLVNHFKSKQESSFPSSSPKICVQNTNRKSRSLAVDVPKLQTLEEEPQLKLPKCTQRCKKPSVIVDERFDSRMKKPTRTLRLAVRNQQEEASLFVRHVSPSPQAKSGSDIHEKKCSRKTRPLLAKKDPSPPATKLPQKQQQVCDSARTIRQGSTFLPSSESSDHSSLGEARHRLGDHDRNKGGGDWSDESLNFYIDRVLKLCCNPEESDILSSSINFKHFSTSHALDPSMFHLLELETNLADCANCQLRHKCNRKLLFDLLDEILADACSKPVQLNGGSRTGQVITSKLCSIVRSFPSADCQYLEDIDGLIEGDMAKTKSKVSAEEGIGLAQEIEQDIMDTLIRETAMACGATLT